MFGINDIRLRVPESTNKNIRVLTPEAVAAPVLPVLVCNDPNVTPTTIVLRATGVGDGVTSHRNAALVGQRATTGFSSFSYPTALTGLRTTAINGRMCDYTFIDTFTGAGHNTPDFHAFDQPPGSNTWTAFSAMSPDVDVTGGQFRPQAQSAAGTYGRYGTNVLANANWPDCFVEASFVWQNASNDIVSINLRDVGGDGYYIGWSDSNATWDVGYTTGGTYVSLGVNSADNLFDRSTVGQTHLVRLELRCDVSNPADAATTIYLQGFVDGLLVVDTSDTIGNRIPDSGQFGIQVGDSGISTGGPTLYIDYIRGGVLTKTPTGFAATTSQGVLTPSVNGGNSSNLTGNAATTAQGVIVPEVQGKLVGQAATGTGGALTPSIVYPGAALTGLRATTRITGPGYNNNSTDVVMFIGGTPLEASAGSMASGLTIGSLTGVETTPLKPKVVVTTQAVGAGAQTYFVPKTATLPSLGLLSQVASLTTQDGFGDRTELAPGLGVGLNQVAKPTGTWSGAGGGSLPLLFSVGVDGNYQSTTTPIIGNAAFVVRYNLPLSNSDVPDITPLGLYASGSLSSVMFYPKKFRPGPVNPLSSIVVWPAPTNPNDITATPPLCVTAFTMLEGQKSVATAGVPTKSVAYPGQTWVQLTGLSAAVSQMDVGQGQVQLPTNPDTLAGFAQTSQGILTASGPGRGALLNDLTYMAAAVATTASGVLVPSINDVFVGPAFVIKRANTTVWSEEFFSPDFSGQDAIFASDAWSFVKYNAVMPNMQGIVVTPTGYGNIVYVSYLSHERTRTNLGWIDTTRQDYTMGLLVVDVATGRIYSNTVYRPPLVYEELRVRGQRYVAEVFKLSTGVSVAQYAHYGIVNLQWTAATVLTPSIAFKHSPPRTFGSGPLFVPSSSAVDFWEEVTSRGDQVQHRLVQNTVSHAYDVSAVWVNDVTDPTSQWVLTTTTNNGPIATADTPDMFPQVIYGYNYGGGYGGNKPAFGFIGYQQEQANVNPTNKGKSVAWFDHWNGLNPLFSVQASGRVGQVSVNVGPVVQLVGLRATTSSGPDSPFPIKTGDAHVWMVGRTATTRAGWILPPAVTFLLDNFDDTNGVLLTAHTSDSGAAWTGDDKTQILSNKAVPTWSSGTANSSKHYASQQAPTPDYRVTFHMSPTYSGTHLGGVPETNIYIRYNSSTGDGYRVGYNGAEEYLYLQRIAGPPTTLASGSIGFVYATDEFIVDISGDNPTRITVYVNGVVWVDAYDYSAFRVTPTGYVATQFNGVNAAPGGILDINGVYFDPSVNLLNGYRATTSVGQLVVAGGTTGLRANTSAGILTPEQPTNITQALTGIALATTQGVLYSNPGMVLFTGFSLTATQGVLTPVGASPTLQALFGQRATMAAGLLALLNRELPLLTAYTRIGNIGVVVDGLPPMVGLRLNLSFTAPYPNFDKSFTGLPATAAAGVVAPKVDPRPYTGFTAATGAGFLTPSTSVSVALVGLSASTNNGTLTPVAAEAGSAAGLTANTTAGTLVPVVSATLLGSVATTGMGVVIPLVGATLIGQAMSLSQGAQQILLNIYLSGRTATLAQGTMGNTHGGTVFQTGVWATGVVGYQPPVRDQDFDLYLFVTMRVDEPHTIVADTEDEVLISPPP